MDKKYCSRYPDCKKKGALMCKGCDICEYCSRECAELYWEMGHKNWCHLINGGTQSDIVEYIAAKVKRGEREIGDDDEEEESERKRRRMEQEKDEESVVEEVEYNELYSMGTDSLQNILSYLPLNDILNRVAMVNKTLSRLTKNSPIIWQSKKLLVKNVEGGFKHVDIEEKDKEVARRKKLDNFIEKFVSFVEGNGIRKFKFYGARMCDVLLPRVLHLAEEVEIEETLGGNINNYKRHMWEANETPKQAIPLRKLICDNVWDIMIGGPNGVAMSMPYGMHFLLIHNVPHLEVFHVNSRNDYSQKLALDLLTNKNKLKSVGLNLGNVIGERIFEEIRDKPLVYLRYGKRCESERIVNELTSKQRSVWMDTLEELVIDNSIDLSDSQNALQYLPNLKRLAVKCEDGSLPILRMVSRQLESLILLEPRDENRGGVDFSNYAERFPLLKTLQIHFPSPVFYGRYAQVPADHFRNTPFELLNRCTTDDDKTVSDIENVIFDAKKYTESYRVGIPLPFMSNLKKLQVPYMGSSYSDPTELLTKVRSPDLTILQVPRTIIVEELSWRNFFRVSERIENYAGHHNALSYINPARLESINIYIGDNGHSILTEDDNPFSKLKNLRELSVEGNTAKDLPYPEMMRRWPRESPVEQLTFKPGITDIHPINSSKLFANFPHLKVLDITIEYISAPHLAWALKNVQTLSVLELTVDKEGMSRDNIFKCDYLMNRMERVSIRFRGNHIPSMVIIFLAFAFESAGRSWSNNCVLIPGQENDYFDQDEPYGRENSNMKGYFPFWKQRELYKLITSERKADYVEFYDIFIGAVIDSIVGDERLIGASEEVLRAVKEKGAGFFLGSFNHYTRKIPIPEAVVTQDM